MSIERYRSTWRTITFNGRLDDSGVVDVMSNLDATKIQSDYYLDSADITRISIQDYRELRQYLEGAEPNEAYEGVRIINLRGRVAGATYADLEDKVWAMFEAFSPAACRNAFVANDPSGVGPWDFKRASAGGAKALRFYARPATGRPVIVGRARGGLNRPYIAQLVAFDPRCYAQSQTSTALGNLSGGNNTVTNNGNLYTHPRIKVVFSAAGAVSVILANATTGQQLGLDLSAMAAGETLVIDTQSGKFWRLSDLANRYSCRTAGYASQFTLTPGANTITWSVATGITSVTFEFRDAYA